MTPDEQLIWQEYIFDRCEEPDENGCLNWASFTNEIGYGQCRFNRTGGHLAHRLAYEAFKGDIPTGLVVRHTCHNPRCVNADHLIVGTNADNMADRTDPSRGRLSAAQVSEIKRLLRAKEFSQSRIADKFGVARTTILKIAHGRYWKHIS